MPNENDNKLVTLADLGEAYNDLDDKIDDKLVSDFTTLDPVGTFTGNERIPLYLNGENYSTDMQTLLYSAGGGGSNQGAITDYKKVCGPISSLPWTSSADSNITADMYLSYATSSKPSVLSVFDWSTSNNGTITISAKNGGGAVTLSESVTLTLYFSVGMSTAPSILTNLGSNVEDNILKAAPRPGVYGTLGIANGGTNASSVSAARTNLDVYSKAETYAAISQSAANVTALNPARSGDVISGGYIKVGKVVIVSFKLTLASNVSVNTAVVSNSPQANISGSICILGFADAYGKRGNLFMLRDYSGTLIANSDMEAGTYVFDGCYIAN